MVKVERDIGVFNHYTRINGFPSDGLTTVRTEFLKVVEKEPFPVHLFYLTRLFHKISNYSIPIRSPSQQITGIGLYPLLSSLNHSCSPNLCFVFAGMRMLVRALRDIEPGEELTVAYVDCRRIAPVRHALLLNNYNFICRCRVCNVGVAVVSEA